MRDLPRSVNPWAVATLLAGMTAAVLDGSLVNLALPSITRELGIAPAQTMWVVNAYQLTIAVLLLPLSSLGERVGYRRVYLTGVAVFMCGAVACALAPSLPLLIAARVVQGIGGAGLMCVTGALVRHIYSPERLGRGIGLNAVVVSVASASGPAVAALVLSVASWKWLFVLCVPACIFTLLVGPRALPSNTPIDAQFDARSAALSGLSICLLILGCDGLGLPETRPLALLEIAASVVLGFILIRKQRNVHAPLLPIDLFRNPAFSLAVGTSLCSFIAQMTALLALPFLLEFALHRSHAETGLLITPWAVAAGFTALVAGRLADRYPAGILVSLGLGLMAVGIAASALLPQDASIADVIWRTALCGLGFGLFQSPNNRALLGVAPRERAGGASGVQATTRLLGQSLGTAMVAVIFNLAPGNGARHALFAAAAAAALGAIVSALRLRA
ncbi:MAG: MFS transporter [Burkholderiaceae bacterium]